MAERVKLGLIGTGGIMGLHVSRLLELKEAHIAALADTAPAHIERLKNRFPALAECPAYGSHGEMIRNEELDGVIIASPHNVHCEQIIDCLRAGLHVLCEKPMVSSIRDAHRVIEEEKRAGKLLAIGYQRHTQGEFQFVKKCIESGQTGEVQFVSAFQGQNWMRMTAGSWRQMPQVSLGGQLNDSGSHLIDIILWVTGLKAREVAASIRKFDREVDINSAITIEFANGAVGNISVVGNCPVWWEDITIVCAEWAFFLRQGRLTYSTGDRAELLQLQNTNYGSNCPSHNFVRAILGEEQVAAPSVCGLRTIELTEAAWRSAESGQPVRL